MLIKQELTLINATQTYILFIKKDKATFELALNI